MNDYERSAIRWAWVGGVLLLGTLVAVLPWVLDSAGALTRDASALVLGGVVPVMVALATGLFVARVTRQPRLRREPEPVRMTSGGDGPTWRFQIPDEPHARGGALAAYAAAVLKSDTGNLTREAAFTFLPDDAEGVTREWVRDVQELFIDAGLAYRYGRAVQPNHRGKQALEAMTTGGRAALREALDASAARSPVPPTRLRMSGPPIGVTSSPTERADQLGRRNGG